MPPNGAGDREIVTAAAGQVASAHRLRDAESAQQLACRARLRRLACVSATGSARSAGTRQHHLEMYYALMGAGLVCHTLNPRLTAAHLAAMINEAEDRALAVASNLRHCWRNWRRCVRASSTSS